MRVIARTPVDLIIADYRMPGLTGLDLLAQLDKEGYKIPVIIMTGYSSIEHAVMSIKSGAIDYLTKPIQAETLDIAVRQALEVVRLRRENETFRREIVKIRGSRSLIGDSEPFRRAMEVVSTVAASRATVLLQGESGTGKELFARAIHDQSPRADEPFITVNCAALPEGLVESALFGHEKGAFTGATVRSAGAFERAHGGTLLLDEISEMRLDLQSKLLRVIQEQEFERVGGHQPIQVDVRLIATTNRDLKTGSGRGAVPERPLLSAQRRADPHPQPPGADRRHPPPRAPFRHPLGGAARREPAEHRSGDPGDPPALHLARQRQGAGQRGGAGGHPLPGQHSPAHRLRSADPGRRRPPAASGDRAREPRRRRRSTTTWTPWSVSRSSARSPRPAATAPARRGCSASVNGPSATSSTRRAPPPAAEPNFPAATRQERSGRRKILPAVLPGSPIFGSLPRLALPSEHVSPQALTR